jgi:uncharacterized protein (TIGR02145 family)
MKNKFLLMTIAILIFAMSSAAQETGTFTDSRDGKTYKTVIIGNQTWMAENLAYKADSCCWAYDNDPYNVTTYGYLYNWETAKKVCPAGWHLPTEKEWTTLKKYLGGNDSNKKDVSGGKMKETGTIHWRGPNTGATNKSGFTALPGGLVINDTCKYIGNNGKWWSSVKLKFVYGNDSIIKVLTCSLAYNSAHFTELEFGEKSMGLSIRCVKD